MEEYQLLLRENNINDYDGNYLKFDNYWKKKGIKKYFDLWGIIFLIILTCCVAYGGIYISNSINNDINITLNWLNTFVAFFGGLLVTSTQGYLTNHSRNYPWLKISKKPYNIRIIGISMEMNRSFIDGLLMLKLKDFKSSIIIIIIIVIIINTIGSNLASASLAGIFFINDFSYCNDTTMIITGVSPLASDAYGNVENIPTGSGTLISLGLGFGYTDFINITNFSNIANNYIPWVPYTLFKGNDIYYLTNTTLWNIDTKCYPGDIFNSSFKLNNDIEYTVNWKVNNQIRNFSFTNTPGLIMKANSSRIPDIPIVLGRTSIIDMIGLGGNWKKETLFNNYTMNFTELIDIYNITATTCEITVLVQNGKCIWNGSYYCENINNSTYIPSLSVSDIYIPGTENTIVLAPYFYGDRINNATTSYFGSGSLFSPLLYDIPINNTFNNFLFDITQIQNNIHNMVKSMVLAATVSTIKQDYYNQFSTNVKHCWTEPKLQILQWRFWVTIIICLILSIIFHTLNLLIEKEIGILRSGNDILVMASSNGKYSSSLFEKLTSCELKEMLNKLDNKKIMYGEVYFKNNVGHAEISEKANVIIKNRKYI